MTGHKSLKFTFPLLIIFCSFALKTQLDKLQKEIAAAAKKTGISSATKLALITPKEAQEDFVPDIEWWDANILPSGKYMNNLQTDIIEAYISGVTALVEHPVQKHPPGNYINFMTSWSFSQCRLTPTFS